MSYPVTVADVMLRGIPTLPSDAAWRDAVPPLLEDARVALPVLDRLGRVVGILTRSDLAVRLSGLERTELRAVLDCAVLTRSFRTVMRWHDREGQASAITVASLMSSPVVTVQARMSLQTVATILFTHDIAQVPVTDGTKRLVGMIRRQELVAALAGGRQSVRPEGTEGQVRIIPRLSAANDPRERHIGTAWPALTATTVP